MNLTKRTKSESNGTFLISNIFPYQKMVWHRISLFPERWYNHETGETRTVNPSHSYRQHKRTHTSSSSSNNIGFTVTVYYKNRSIKENKILKEMELDSITEESSVAVLIEMDATGFTQQRVFSREQCMAALSRQDTKELNDCQEDNDGNRSKLLLKLIARNVSVQGDPVAATAIDKQQQRQQEEEDEEEDKEEEEEEDKHRQDWDIVLISSSTNNTAAISSTTSSKWSLAEVQRKKLNYQRACLKAQSAARRASALQVLQCSFRIVLSLRRCEWRRKKMKQLHDRQVKRETLRCAIQSAVTIQKYVRDYMYRSNIERYLLRKNAATLMQKIARGYNERMRMRMIVVATSVLAIQCAIRIWQAQATVAWRDQTKKVRENVRHEEEKALEGLRARQQQAWQAQQQQQVQQAQNVILSDTPLVEIPAPAAAALMMMPVVVWNRPVPSKELLKDSIGMRQDELEELELLMPMMDSAALIIQQQYHCLQARRKLEWRKQVKIHKEMLIEKIRVTRQFEKGQQGESENVFLLIFSSFIFEVCTDLSENNIYVIPFYLFFIYF